VHRVPLFQEPACGECFSEQRPKSFFSVASVGLRELCVELLDSPHGRKKLGNSSPTAFSYLPAVTHRLASTRDSPAVPPQPEIALRHPAGEANVYHAACRQCKGLRGSGVGSREWGRNSPSFPIRYSLLPIPYSRISSYDGKVRQRGRPASPGRPTRVSP
jgi:hypothetical protein